jgi:hypothetical protein
MAGLEASNNSNDVSAVLSSQIFQVFSDLFNSSEQVATRRLQTRSGIGVVLFPVFREPLSVSVSI